MKVTDYIVEYLINRSVTDVFGYPGGMVTHLIDSFSHYQDRIQAHVCYHEQAAAFEACGYSQTSGKVGVAYATSGPGATNLITGICDAYFDSVPTLFITGQVNTFESKEGYNVRQRGFQETDIVSMVRPVTKYCHYVCDTDDLIVSLDKAYQIAMSGRKGPVLLDIPMNIQRGEIPDDMARKHLLSAGVISSKGGAKDDVLKIIAALKQAQKPVMLVGAGTKDSNTKKLVKEFAKKTRIPMLSSMIAFDVEAGDEDNYGFVGAYGERVANFIVAKSDLILSIGARLDIRQTGAVRKNFAPDAKIIRIDIDAGELEYQIRENEMDICANAEDIFNLLLKEELPTTASSWLETCNKLKEKLKGFDDKYPNQIVKKISEKTPDGITITTDVGQNQVWVSQSFVLKKNQRVLFSGGHGAMGYSLPAAIGAYYGTKKPVLCFCGDGGLQMNIQELQFIARERLPITIVVLNNNALGMIRHFQEMYFQSNYFQTKPEGGYTVPDFEKIAYAYGIKGYTITSIDDIEKINIGTAEPKLINYLIKDDTYVFPKLEYGKPNQDQEPLLDRELYDELMRM